MPRYIQMWADLDPKRNEDFSNWPMLRFNPGENDLNMNRYLSLSKDYRFREQNIAIVPSALTPWLKGGPSIHNAAPRDNATPEDNVVVPNGNIPPTTKGFTVLLCPASETDSTNASYPWSNAPSTLRTVPLSKHILGTIAKRFNISATVFQIIAETYTHMSTPDFEANETASNTCSALFHSGVSNYPGNIALVYTHSPKHESSCGIFLGCSEKDMDAVYDMLDRCGPTCTDPLLLPIVFAELQTSHLRELQEAFMDHAHNIFTEFEILLRSQKHSYRLDLIRKLDTVRADVITFEDDIAIANRHLKSLIDCSHYASDKRFRKRFEQISREYDDLLGACRPILQTAVISADTYQAGISRHLANTSMVLAFVAMIYLPISTVATIFAIPIIDFKADWRDIHGNPVHSSLNSSGAQPVVVSYYLTHYLGISFALLFLTLEGWHMFTRKQTFDWRLFWKYLLTTKFLIKLCIVVWRASNQPWEALRHLWRALRSLSKFLTIQRSGPSMERTLPRWVEMRTVPSNGGAGGSQNASSG
ncbi:hypothetical protein F5Y14DRAFT_450489 [Nemania sp. NC0429]|nr:hypothetical protein F5Y14DRAFT_450489 [Nemania sp. NC0429]